MQRSLSIAELEKFHFGVRIICSNGEEGVLTHVGFDPSTRRMTHFGVKLGRFFGKTVFVPFSSVDAAASDGIRLNITHEELSLASRTAPVGVLLDAHSTVVNTQGTNKGGLKTVAAQAKSGELAYLIVHNLRPNYDLLLQEEVISKVDAGQVTVTVPEALLLTLPHYRSDEELQNEVEAILFELAPLHIDFPGMRTRVLDSVLYLDGNISSSLRSDIVQNQVMGVPGLLEVKNMLVGDDSLAADLAQALGNDPRTSGLPIGVYPRLGHVRLSGAVHNDQQKVAAGEIASSFSAVRSVDNNLMVDANAILLRVMSASAGGEASDIIPGNYTRHTK